MRELALGKDDEGLHSAVASACLLASACCAVVWTASHSVSLAALALVGPLVASAWVAHVGARPAVVATCLCIAPPGLIGENYGVVGGAALVVLWLAFLSAPTERVAAFPLAPVLIGGEAIAFFLTSLTAHNQQTKHVEVVVAALYVAASMVARELSKRPALTREGLRALTLLAALACTSYLVSAIVGFAGTRRLNLPFRTLSFAPPATLIEHNGADYLGLPRFLVVSGEPGLGAVFLLVAIASAFILERRRRRFALLTLLGGGVIAAQSTGLLFGLVAMACVSMLAVVTKRVAFIAATAMALAVIPGLHLLALQLISRKEQANSLSVTDRGLAGTTTGSSISLSATWAHAALLVVPLVALLAYLAFVCLQRPIELGFVAAIAVIAWYAQPLQDHPGIWLMLFSVVLLARVPQETIGPARVPFGAESSLRKPEDLLRIGKTRNVRSSRLQ